MPTVRIFYWGFFLHHWSNEISPIIAWYPHRRSQYFPQKPPCPIQRYWVLDEESGKNSGLIIIFHTRTAWLMEFLVHNFRT